MRSFPSRSRAVLGAALAVLLLVPVAMPAVAQDASAAPAPVFADVTTEGGALAIRFLEILGLPDEEKVAELDTFLADEFQIVRATGAHLDKAGYLADPADVHQFQVTDVVATQHEDIVVVSYLLATTETIDGVEQTTTAPRLSVFHWNGVLWQLAAHGNFGAIATTPDPSASPAA